MVVVVVVVAVVVIGTSARTHVRRPTGQNTPLARYRRDLFAEILCPHVFGNVKKCACHKYVSGTWRQYEAIMRAVIVFLVCLSS